MHYLIAPLIFAAGLFAWLPVALCATVRRYPWWLLTPDDRVSPFGQYEPQVRAVYARWGRWVGDVYWLGLRNRLMGLSYRFKPQWLKDLASYDALQFTLRRHWGADVLELERPSAPDVYGDARLVDYRPPARLSEHRWQVGPVVLIWGTALTQIAKHPRGLPVRAVNMDGRPTFTARLARNAP